MNNLLVCTDDANWRYAVVVIRSFQASGVVGCRILVATTSWLAIREMRKYLGEEVEYCDADSAARAIKQMPERLHFSRAMFLRVFWDQLFPSVEGRVLYIDTDCLFLSGNEGVFGFDLQGSVIGAVPNPECLSEIRGEVASYFNSGVLLFDAAAWRELGVTSRLCDLITSRGSSFQYPDQDALNLILDRKWIPLPLELNMQPSYFRAGRSLPEFGGIIHFSGSPKPWEFRCALPHVRLYRARAVELGLGAFVGWRGLFRSELRKLIRKLR